MGFADHNVDLSQTSIRVQPLPNTLPLIEIGLRDGEQSLNKENFQKGKSSLSTIKFHSIESRKICVVVTYKTLAVESICGEEARCLVWGWL
jgi:hypothetical protein